MAKTREINGRAFPRREFVNYLMKAVEKADPDLPTVQGVIDVFADPEWDCKEARFALMQELNGLHRRGLLERIERGRFRVTSKWKREGQGEWHLREQEVIETIRAEGGIIRWRDLMHASGVTEAEGGPLLRKALTSSARVRRDFEIRHHDVSAIPEDRRKQTGLASVSTRKKRAETIAKRHRSDLPRDHGYLNLPQTEIAALPREGRWVRRLTRVALLNANAPGAFDQSAPWERLVEHQLRSIGRTLALLRETCDCDAVELIEDEHVAAALDAAIERYRDAYQTIGEQDDPDARRLMMLERIEGAVQFETHKTALGEEVTEEIDLFRTGAHLALRSDFWNAVGAFFHVSPAALSRGIVEPDVSEPGEDWNHFFDRMDADAAKSGETT